MSQKEFLIAADDDGNLIHIYDDAIAFLSDLGHTETKRASHVEPAEDGNWYADMAPVSGPVLGPFTLRKTALDAEVEYIKRNVL